MINDLEPFPGLNDQHNFFSPGVPLIPKFNYYYQNINRPTLILPLFIKFPSLY